MRRSAFVLLLAVLLIPAVAQGFTLNEREIEVSITGPVMVAQVVADQGEHVHLNVETAVDQQNSAAWADFITLDVYQCDVQGQNCGFDFSRVSPQGNPASSLLYQTEMILPRAEQDQEWSYRINPSLGQVPNPMSAEEHDLPLGYSTQAWTYTLGDGAADTPMEAGNANAPGQILIPFDAPAELDLEISCVLTCMMGMC